MTQDERMYQYVISKVPNLANEPDKEKVIAYGFARTGAKRDKIEIGEQMAAGFGQREGTAPGLINKAARFVGENLPPALGAAMGAPAGIPGMVAGAMAGRAAQKAYGQVVNLAKPGFAKREDPNSVALDVASQGAGELLAGPTKALGKAIWQKGAAPVGGVMTSAMTGIPVRNAIKAWKDPMVLLRGGSVEKTGEALKAITDQYTDNNWETRALAFFNTRTPGPRQVERLTDKVLEETGTGKYVGWTKLLAVREQIERLIERTNPEAQAQMRAQYAKKLKTLATLIEEQVPGYNKAKTNVHEAMVKKDFTRPLPTYIDKQANRVPDWRRVAGAASIAGGGVYKGDLFRYGALALPGVSPVVHGLGISGLAGVQAALNAAEKGQMDTFVLRPLLANAVKMASPAERDKLKQMLKTRKINIPLDALEYDPMGLAEVKIK